MREVKDFVFVDTVSGTPIGRKEVAYAPRIYARRSGIEAVLFGLIALIVLLATWALS